MERAGTKAGGAKTNQFILSQYLQLGSLKIRYYGITMAAAIVIGYFIGWSRAKKAGWSLKFYDDFAFWLVVFSFISARIYYVIFYPQFYKNNFAEIFKIWHGGLAIYGAIIGGILTTLYFSAKHKINFLKIADIIVPALPLAQAVGRFGNFFNYEAFGYPTNLPWKMFVPTQFRPQGYIQYSYFHPTFAYEAVWDVLVFLAIILVGRKQRRDGLISALYLILYSVGRFIIEAIRLDSAFFGPLRGDQLTAVFMILFGLAIILRQYATPNN